MVKRKTKGGLNIKNDLSQEEAIINFIQNSSITIIPGTTKSGSGAIFICNLNSGYDSPYESLRYSSDGSSVDQIAIKLVATGEYSGKWKGDYFTNEKNIESEDAFFNEQSIQKTIFNKTKSQFDPVCPAIIYYSVIKSQSSAVSFLDTLLSRIGSDENAANMLTDFKNGIETEKIPWLGVLGMEMASGYRTLKQIHADASIDKNAMKIYENMARLRILEMAEKTGYSQNDFHRENVLINTDMKGYFKGLSGHVLIIDFGFASLIPDKPFGEIMDNINKNNLVGALSVFEGLRRPDGAPLNYYSLYGWLYFRYNHTIKNGSVSMIQASKKNYDNNSALIALKNDRDDATRERLLLMKSKTPSLNSKTRKIKIRSSKN